MFGIADYGAFCVAVIVFLAVPGPGNLALVTSTAQSGVRAGLATSLGVMAGDQLLMWLAVAGVAAVLQASPRLFAAVQWLGAGYLVYLGVKMLLAKPGGAPVLRMEARRYLQQGIGITLLNPKAIVFYMAFFPLFVHPQTHLGLLTFAAMAITIAGLTFLYCVTLVLLTRYLADRMRAHPSIGSALNKLAGATLVAFGAKLALGK